MREERDGEIRHHTKIRHVDVRCQGGNSVWPDGDKRILENRGFTDFAPIWVHAPDASTPPGFNFG